jgi:hypothetical protein
MGVFFLLLNIVPVLRFCVESYMNFHNFQTFLSFSSDNMIPGAAHPLVAIGVRNGLNTVGALPPFHLTTERDPVSDRCIFTNIRLQTKSRNSAIPR